jgi:TonB family protein
MQREFDLAEIEVHDGSRAIEVAALFEESVLEVAYVHGKSDFAIGPIAGVQFNVPCEALPANAFPLVRCRDERAQLCFTSQMSGEVSVDGQSLSLEQLARAGRARPSPSLASSYTWLIPDGASARIRLAHNTFLISSVAPPRRQPVPLQIDWAEHAYTAALAAIAGLFLILLMSLPPTPKSLAVDDFAAHRRFARFLLKPPEEPPAPAQRAPVQGSLPKPSPRRMGIERVRITARERGAQPTPDRERMRRAAQERALDSGVLAILRATEGAHIASVFGRNPALGENGEQVLSSITGILPDELWGVGGVLDQGGARKGGGDGEATIGLDRLATLGKSGGDGDSYARRGVGSLHVRRARAPEIIDAGARVVGTLDKEIIRRTVRRHLNEVRFCYEKELSRKQDLAGRIVVQFTIAGTGRVVGAAAQSSTTGDPSLDQCVVQAVGRWEFPPPPRGLVTVAYPFLLKTAGVD